MNFLWVIKRKYLNFPYEKGSAIFGHTSEDIAARIVGARASIVLQEEKKYEAIKTGKESFS